MEKAQRSMAELPGPDLVKVHEVLIQTESEAGLAQSDQRSSSRCFSRVKSCILTHNVGVVVILILTGFGLAITDSMEKTQRSMAELPGPDLAEVQEVLIQKESKAGSAQSDTAFMKKTQRSKAEPPGPDLVEVHEVLIQKESEASLARSDTAFMEKTQRSMAELPGPDLVEVHEVLIQTESEAGLAQSDQRSSSGCFSRVKSFILTHTVNIVVILVLTGLAITASVVQGLKKEGFIPGASFGV